MSFPSCQCCIKCLERTSCTNSLCIVANKNWDYVQRDEEIEVLLIFLAAISLVTLTRLAIWIEQYNSTLFGMSLFIFVQHKKNMHVKLCQ